MAPVAPGQVREADARYVRLPKPQGTLVDSCVLIDVLAEVSPRFERAADLESALAGLPLVRRPLPWDAHFLAGQAFKVYRMGKGVKTSPMPDSYIGAHALVENLQLLTRDAARYRSYFPRLPLIAP